MTSYQAATSYIKYSERSNKHCIVTGPELKLFGAYFAKFTDCHIIKPDQLNKNYLSFLKSRNPQKITYWGYALSDIALLTVQFACRQGSPVEIYLPSPLADALYYCNDLNTRVLLREWRSLMTMLIKKMRGWPIKIKTFNNYIYDCIDTRLVTSVRTFTELFSSPQYSEARYSAFAEFVGDRYSQVVKNLRINPNTFIVLDENLEFYEKRTGNCARDLMNAFEKVLNTLIQSGFAVFLKPTYYGQPSLSRYFRFTGIIPGEIPLQALDLLVPKNTVITGWSATYLHESSLNFRSIPIKQLPLYIKQIS